MSSAPSETPPVSQDGSEAPRSPAASVPGPGPASTASGHNSPVPMSPQAALSDAGTDTVESRDSVGTTESFQMVSPASPVNLPPVDQETVVPSMSTEEALASLDGDFKNVVRRGRYLREGPFVKPATFRDKKWIGVLFSNVLLIARPSKSVHPKRKVEEIIDLRQWFVRPCIPAPIEAGKKKSKSDEKKAAKMLCSIELVCPGDTMRNQTYVTESHAARDRWVYDICSSAVEALRGQGPPAGPGREIALGTDQLRMHVLQAGSTLHSAALMGLVDKVSEHIAAGEIHIDARDPSGSTPLHLAVLANWPRVVQTLVSHGADMNVADSFGHTPLHIAVVYEREMIAEQLCSSDLCNTNFADYLGRTPVQLALHHNAMSVLRALCRSESVQRGLKGRDSQGLTPLMRACQLGNATAARILIQAHADIMAQAGEPVNKPEGAPLIHAGKTALGFAVIGDDLECTKVCVEEGGAWMNFKDMNGDTLLHTCPTLRIADYLIQHGARMDIPNAHGRYGGRFIGNIINPDLSKDQNKAIVERAIQVAKGMWEGRHEDTTMIRPVPGSRLFKPQMIPDESSPACVVCSAEFSLLKRRHHCRNCGVLVCAACSTKKFRLPHLTTQYQTTGKLPPDSSVSPERTCDACFNFLYHLSHNTERLTIGGDSDDHDSGVSGTAVAAAGAAGAVGVGAAAIAAGGSAGGDDDSNRAELLGTRDGRAPTSAEQDWLNTMDEASKEKQAKSNASQAQSAALDAKKGLEERGEKLQSLAENMERLNNEAADFERMCSQLAQQEKKKSSWW